MHKSYEDSMCIVTKRAYNENRGTAGLTVSLLLCSDKPSLVAVFADEQAFVALEVAGEI